MLGQKWPELAVVGLSSSGSVAELIESPPFIFIHPWPMTKLPLDPQCLQIQARACQSLLRVRFFMETRFGARCRLSLSFYSLLLVSVADHHCVWQETNLKVCLDGLQENLHPTITRLCSNSFVSILCSFEKHYSHCCKRPPRRRTKQRRPWDDWSSSCKLFPVVKVFIESQSSYSTLCGSLVMIKRCFRYLACSWILGKSRV